MFAKFNIFKDIIELVRLANRYSDMSPHDTPKFGFLLTNRSFLVPALGIIFNILLMLNVPFLAPVIAAIQAIPIDVTVEYIVVAVTALTFIWSFIERILTPAKVVLTRKQAERAVEEVVGDDMLSKSLKKAIIGK